jgi:hypothetical protein
MFAQSYGSWIPQALKWQTLPSENALATIKSVPAGYVPCQVTCDTGVTVPKSVSPGPRVRLVAPCPATTFQRNTLAAETLLTKTSELPPELVHWPPTEITFGIVKIVCAPAAGVESGWPL